MMLDVGMMGFRESVPIRETDSRIEICGGREGRIGVVHEDMICDHYINVRYRCTSVSSLSLDWY